jgi:hypothetical protein
VAVVLVVCSVLLQQDQAENLARRTSRRLSGTGAVNSILHADETVTSSMGTTMVP